MTTVLGVQCNACGTNRKYKSLGYDPETFLAYCENAWICNEHHPNSSANIIKRQSQIELVDYKTAVDLYSKTVILDKSDKVRKLMQNPLTVRIIKPEMAQFLIDEADTKSLTISELVRSYIESLMSPTSVEHKPIEKPKKIKIDDSDLIF